MRLRRRFARRSTVSRETSRSSRRRYVPFSMAASPADPCSQLVQSRQSGARAAFAEVQNRNQDLRKIEETITQLAQMMQDVRLARSSLVEWS